MWPEGEHDDEFWQQWSTGSAASSNEGITMQRDHEVLRRQIPRAARVFAVYYAASGWIWTARDGKGCPAYVPTAHDIARVLTQRLDDHIDDAGDWCSSTGGLTVWREGDEMGLSFEDDIVVDLDNLDAEPLGEPPSINAVDPVPGVVAEVRRATDDSSLPSTPAAPPPARTEEP